MFFILLWEGSCQKVVLRRGMHVPVVVVRDASCLVYVLPKSEWSSSIRRVSNEPKQGLDLFHSTSEAWMLFFWSTTWAYGPGKEERQCWERRGENMNRKTQELAEQMTEVVKLWGKIPILYLSLLCTQSLAECWCLAQNRKGEWRVGKHYQTTNSAWFFRFTFFS